MLFSAIKTLWGVKQDIIVNKNIIKCCDMVNKTLCTYIVMVVNYLLCSLAECIEGELVGCQVHPQSNKYLHSLQAILLQDGQI